MSGGMLLLNIKNAKSVLKDIDFKKGIKKIDKIADADASLEERGRAYERSNDFDRYNKYWDNIAKKIAVDKHLNGKLSDGQVRAWYKYKETIINNYIDKSLPLKDQASQAWAYRNYIRTRARDLMANRELAAEWWKKAPNKSWLQIVELYQSRGYKGDSLWKEIISAAQRSRKTVDNKVFRGK